MSHHSTLSLPNKIIHSGVLTTLIPLAHGVFRQDLLNSSLTFCNLQLRVRRDLDPNTQMEVVFLHIITREDKAQGIRIPEIPRCERVPWIRPMIDDYSAVGIESWRYLEGSGKIRWYLWAKQEDYMVILEEGRNCYFFVTSFCVDRWNHKYYDQKKLKCIV